MRDDHDEDDARRRDPRQYPQLLKKYVSKTKRGARLRKAGSFTFTLLVMSLMASRARAELHQAPRLSFLRAVQPLHMELAPHASLMTPPFFLLLPIGISGRTSFRSTTARIELRTIVTFGAADALCLGARCAPRIGSMSTLEPGVAARSGSTHAVESFGLGKAALKLFANPVPKPGGVAFGVSPMFACAGAGLELRMESW